MDELSTEMENGAFYEDINTLVFFYHYKTYEMKRFKAIFLIYIVFAGLQFIHVFNIIYSCVFHMTFICECHQLDCECWFFWSCF